MTGLYESVDELVGHLEQMLHDTKRFRGNILSVDASASENSRINAENNKA